MLKDTFEIALKNKIEDQIQDYIHKVSVWVAKLFIKNTKKYKLSHTQDPPWDHSGSLVLIGSLQLEEFREKRLRELLSQFNGNTTASFQSGCGFFHSTYEDVFFDMTLEWVYGLTESVASDLKKAGNSATVSMIQDLEANEDKWSDFVTDCVYIVTHEQMEKMQSVNIDFLYRLGKDQAQSQIGMERVEASKQQMEHQNNQQMADEIWGKIARRYQWYYGKKPPTKIEADCYNNELKPLLSKMCQEEITAEDIRLVGTYCPFHFSNSVRSKLTHWE